jgi:predicted RNA-binding protein with PIN domain
MADTYYIDGYNVIHHSAALRPLLKHSFENARDALIDRAARFAIATGLQVKVVFDGRGRKAESATPVLTAPGLEVMYSPGHLTADAMIERIVYNSPDRRSVVVVSADRGIRTLCHTLNALVMDPDNFLASVEEKDALTRSIVQNMQKPDGASRVEERLDGDTIEKLRNLRDKLK